MDKKSIIVVVIVISLAVILILFILPFPASFIVTIVGLLTILGGFLLWQGISSRNNKTTHPKPKSKYFGHLVEIFKLISEIKSQEYKDINPEKHTTVLLNDIKSELKQIKDNSVNQYKKGVDNYHQSTPPPVQESHPTTFNNQYEQQSSTPPNKTTHRFQSDEHSEEEPYPKITLQSEDTIQSFTNIYNQAINNRDSRQKFKAEYKIHQFGNRNASDQAQGKTTAVDFYSSDTGDYIAVPAPDHVYFWVVPKFGSSFNDTAYNEGGFGQVFDCQEYQPGGSYSDFQVIRPAIFERKGEHWKQIKQGELKLFS